MAHLMKFYLLQWEVMKVKFLINSNILGIWLGSFKNNPDIYSGIRFTNHPIKCLGIYIGTDYKACEDLNWGIKLKEIEDLTLQWRKRKLTLQGKITVINNLLIPKMIYPMTVLYTPPEVTKRIENIIYVFLWEKCHRVKKTIVTQQNINGGLNMTDIQSKLYALKATWIPKFLNNRNRIANIVNMYLTSINLNMSLILRTTFRKSDSFDIIKKIPMFYQQIFISLNECKTIKPINNLSNFEFLTQPLWGNEYFKFKNKHLYYRNWIESNIIFIKDLFDKNGFFISEENLLIKLKNKQNWMTEYLTLKKIINKLAKHKFNTKQGQFIQTSACMKTNFWAKGNLIHPENIKTKEIYNILLSKKYEKPYVENMWEKRLTNEVNNINWAEVYTQNFKCLKYSKFTEFKFKIIHNVLPCGKQLCRWNNNYSGLCVYCGEVENITHLLYECSRIKNIWRVVSNCMKTNILLKHIIIGFQFNNENYVLQNKIICIVIISYAIYSVWCKCNINNKNYKNTDVKSNIKQQLSFYLEVFKSIFDNPRKEHLKCLGECILYHLI